MKFVLFFTVLLIITTTVYCLVPKNHGDHGTVDHGYATRNKRDDYNIEDFKLGPMVRTKPEDLEMNKKA